MKVAANWAAPIELLDARKQNAIYRIGDLSRVPRTAGIYVFARKFGARVVAPLYIGQTSTDLRDRLERHLKELPLMMGIKQAPAGKRLYLYAQVQTKRGQKIEKVLDVLERALIAHALSAGYKLSNTQHTRGGVHTINFDGNRTSEKLFPRQMFRAHN